jgi:hypothetical protein
MGLHQASDEMLIPVDLASVNSVADMPVGAYAARCLVYSPQGGDSQAMLFEYSHLESGQVRGCDLVIIDADAVVRASDFVLLRDMSWRDSFGEKAGNLLELFPSGLANWTLVEERDLSTIQVEETQ